MRSLRAPVFRIDQPNWLPISVPLSLQDLTIAASIATALGKLGQVFLGFGGMLAGFGVGSVIGLSIVFTIRRTLPGPQPAYFLSWLLSERDFYDYQPQSPEPPLIVYAED